MEKDGIEVMFEELQKRDPQAAKSLLLNDRQRILRALEVVDATGKSIVEHQSSPNSAPILDLPNICKFVLSPERPVLHTRIEKRFDEMIKAGAIEEVEALLKMEINPDHPVLKAIGVPQIKQYLTGDIELLDAVEKSKIASRQYAKRQSTWFRNQMSHQWQVIN